MSGRTDLTDDVPRDFHHRWPTLLPPLRPHPAVVVQTDALLGGCDAPVLLLGVTPELAGIGRPIIAVDWSAEMIALAWLGDSDSRRVILGDWKAMPIADASVGGAMGDGALTMLNWPGDAVAVLGELWRVVRPGGHAVIRCFATPEAPESLTALAEVAARGELQFHEWRLRFNMAAARNDDAINITSARLFEHYEADWPSRRDYIDACGWPGDALAEIDAYQGSAYTHCYPKRSEIGQLLATSWPGAWRFAETSGYPGAEHCPLLVLERP